MINSRSEVNRERNASYKSSGSLLGRFALEQSRWGWPRPISARLRTFAVKSGLAALQKEVNYPFKADVVISSMFDLAEQLNPHLENYDLVVGDDTSGRLPAILYWRLVNRRREESGLGSASCMFMSGIYSGDSAPPFPSESTDDSRALIITEWVESGSSVNTIYNAVGRRRDNSRTDIGALGRADDQNLHLADGSAIFFANNSSKDRIDKHLYGAHVRQHKGIYKREGDLYASRLGPIAFSVPMVKQARGDIQLIADTIYPLLPPAA